MKKRFGFETSRGRSRPDRSAYGGVGAAEANVDWWNFLFKAVVAELVATMIFQYVGGLAILTNVGLESKVGSGVFSNIAIANGLAVSFIVATFAHISGGHINPAVTIGLLAARKIDVVKAAFYVMAQVCGAVIGAGLTLVTTTQGDALLIQPGPDVAWGQAVLAEVLGTAILVMVIYSTAVDKKGANASAPLMIGITVVVNIFAIGTISGGAMNPARAIGPAVVLNKGDCQEIYWLGPITGGILGALIYKFVFESPESGQQEQEQERDKAAEHQTEQMFDMPIHGDDNDEEDDEEDDEEAQLVAGGGREGKDGEE